MHVVRLIYVWRKMVREGRLHSSINSLLQHSCMY